MGILVKRMYTQINISWLVTAIPVPGNMLSLISNALMHHQILYYLHIIFLQFNWILAAVGSNTHYYTTNSSTKILTAKRVSWGGPDEGLQKQCTATVVFRAGGQLVKNLTA